MKKIFNILTLCLITISQSYSQTNLLTSNKIDSVLIPVKTLKNALIVLEQRNYYRELLIVARDSILIQDSIIINQDKIINNLTHQTQVYKSNQVDYEQVITNKDKEIDIITDKYKKEKKHKWYGIGGIIIVSILTLLI